MVPSLSDIDEHQRGLKACALSWLRNSARSRTHSVRDVPAPVPGADDVLVEVHAVAANFVDTLLIGGTYQFRPTPPFIPGKLPAGVVKAVGPNVATFKVGERVLAITEYGGYGELVVLPASRCFRIPQSMSFTDAASMSSVYDTALMALRDRAHFQSGETVLVVGATGGVGLASIQLAKALGGKVLAGLANQNKAHLARKAGADAIIDLSAPDLKNDLREQVHAANDGRGADIVLDMLGGDFFEAAVRALAWRGRLVVIGFAAGRIPTVQVNYSAGQEHLDKRHTNQRLSVEGARTDSGLLRGTVLALRGGQDQAVADHDHAD